MRETQERPCATAADGIHVTVPGEMFVEKYAKVFYLFRRNETFFTELNRKSWEVS